MSFTFTFRLVRIQKESSYIYRFTPALLNWLSHLILYCSWVKCGCSQGFQSLTGNEQHLFPNLLVQCIIKTPTLFKACLLPHLGPIAYWEPCQGTSVLLEDGINFCLLFLLLPPP